MRRGKFDRKSGQDRKCKKAAEIEWAGWSMISFNTADLTLSAFSSVLLVSSLGAESTGRDVSEDDVRMKQRWD
jgi:hypothetical protein